MHRIVTALEVNQVNDLWGRKQIEVITQEHDEIIPTTFYLTSRYMIPSEKLALATVAPGDQIEVLFHDTFPVDEVLVGEYVSNHFDPTGRIARCECGRPMVVDEADLYCTNHDCVLTRAARLRQLASSCFFPANAWSFSSDGMFKTNGGFLEYPFLLIREPKFWTRFMRTNHLFHVSESLIDTILKHKNAPYITTATFLVQDQFRELIDAVGPAFPHHSAEYKTLSQFYNIMDQIVYRRDYSAILQNDFLVTFLLSLGVAGVTQEVAQKMVVAEATLGMIDEVMLPYANYLTNSMALQDDLGLMRDHADWIVRDVFVRRHEFFDIFSHYSTSKDVIDIFNRLNQSKRNYDELFKITQIE